MSSKNNNSYVTKAFWDGFYENNLAPEKPSPFCEWLIDYLPIKKYTIIELGCGNGRDTFAFAAKGNKIEGFDQSESGIQYCRKQMCKILSPEQHGNINFTVLNLEDAEKLNLAYGNNEELPNLIYSRFVLHAVRKEIQEKILRHGALTLPVGGIVAHEFRTDKDPLKNKGHVLSNDERITDHYRRFIRPEEITTSLNQLGFEILYFKESNGLAVHKNEDPVVARIVGVKVK